MSLSAAIIDALVASGVTRDQLAAAVKADISDREAEAAARLEDKRAKDRERQKRHRLSRRVTVTACDERDVGFNERDNLTSREEIPQEAKASLPQGAKAKRGAVPWPCPDGVEPSHWRDFLANRKRKRCVQSQTALDGVLDDIRQIADDEWPPGRLVRHAAAKGWASINDPREQQHGRPTNGLGRHQSDGLSPTTRAAVAVFGPPDAGHQRRVPQ